MEKPLLLIGVHKSELAFGDQVARLLGDAVNVLRVDEGLADAKPTPDALFHWCVRHKEMYSQVLQRVGRRRGPMIDLHTGLNQAARCADVYCHNEQFLSFLRHALSLQRESSVRVLPIVTDTSAVTGDTTPVARAYIPPAIWQSSRFLYIGVEVFLPVAGAGEPPDHAFAAQLVRLIIGCARKAGPRTATLAGPVVLARQG